MPEWKSNAPTLDKIFFEICIGKCRDAYTVHTLYYTDTHTHTHTHIYNKAEISTDDRECVCVCMCVCEREREREIDDMNGH